MATMRDVALRAGVSKATVSYILNGRAASMRIPAGTTERVLAVVRELGYHPNAVARSLAYRRTNTIAIVMQFPAVFSGWSGFTNEMMRGVTDAAIRLGYDVLLHTRQPESPSQEDGLELLETELSLLTDGRVDGALLLRDVADPLAETLHARGFPTVLMFTRAVHPDLWFVDCDNARGAELATNYLIGLGHRRIVHLAGPSRSSAGYDRRIGYQQAMRAAGLPVDSACMFEITHAGADFTAALARFDVPAEQRPTAVFAWCDDVAIAMMGLLRARGLRVPEDVAVVGFDSTALCDHTDPPLTSMKQPICQLAEQALTLLVQKIAGDEPPETRVLCEPRLIVRRSCGASFRQNERNSPNFD